MRRSDNLGGRDEKISHSSSRKCAIKACHAAKGRVGRHEKVSIKTTICSGFYFNNFFSFALKLKRKFCALWAKEFVLAALSRPNWKKNKRVRKEVGKRVFLSLERKRQREMKFYIMKCVEYRQLYTFHQSRAFRFFFLSRFSLSFWWLLNVVLIIVL